MLLYGALAGPLPKLGVVAVALLAALVMLHREPRIQALAMLGALVLAPALLLADIWHSPQLSIVHRHPLVAAMGALVALVAVAGGALVLGRRPALLAGAVLVALPFRIPIQAGGTTSNLLVPLYFVLAAGSLAFIVAGLRGRSSPVATTVRPSGGVAPDGRAPGGVAPDGRALGGVASGGRVSSGVASGGLASGGRVSGGVASDGRVSGGVASDGRSGGVASGGRVSGGVASDGRSGGVASDGRASGGLALDAARWLERLLAAYIVLYAVQAAYSPKFEKALQQMVFFYVPFALAFCLLRRIDWTQRLTRRCVALLGGLGVLFAVVGFVEYATKTIFLNPTLIAKNAEHAYFTVNSVFFDPNIFGRFLALVMILLAAVLLYARRPRTQLVTVAVLAILWGALVLTLSRSSLGALLVGLGTLAALRWYVGRAVLAAAVVVALAAAAIAASPTTFGLNQGLNGASSGRPGLVSGGLDLFAGRPVYGYGSGSFETEYAARHHQPGQSGLTASHTIPITIAAEQGLIGELVYLALVVVAVITLLHRARADPARVAIAGAFIALVFHTLLYADFLEDPITWTLLAVGVALARRPLTTPPAEQTPARDLPLEQQLA